MECVLIAIVCNHSFLESLLKLFGVVSTLLLVPSFAWSYAGFAVMFIYMVYWLLICVRLLVRRRCFCCFCFLGSNVV